MTAKDRGMTLPERTAMRRSDLAPRHPRDGGGAVRAPPRRSLPRRIHVSRPSRIFGALAVTLITAMLLLAPATSRSDQVEEKKLIDNAEVLVMEFVFPPGFRGRRARGAGRTSSPTCSRGSLRVVTKGTGKRVVRRGKSSGRRAGRSTIR